MKITDVAVGILQRPDGAVLYAQRPAGKVYEGWWEFPGGKREQGEPIEQTLVRELQEELGVTVTQFTPWVIRDHIYPHATVRLHFFRVTQWLGAPASSEGQALHWQDGALSAPQPLLPAAIPVIDWLVLPTHYVLTSAGQFGVEKTLAAIKSHIEIQPCLIQLFEPTLADDLIIDLYNGLQAIVGDSTGLVGSSGLGGSKLLVHDVHQPLVRHAPQANAGLHLSAANLMAHRVRPEFFLVGADCPTAEHLTHAAALGLDFVVMQADFFEQASRSSRLPVFAAIEWPMAEFGEKKLEALMQRGAHGICTIPVYNRC